MFHRLRTRLILTILALAVLPVLVTGSVVTYLSSNAQETAAVETQQLLVSQASDQIETYIRSREREMKLLVHVTDLIRLTQDQQRSEIAALQSLEEAYEDITLVNASGQELARSSRLSVISQNDLGNRAGDTAFTQTRDNGQTYFSSVSFNEATGEPFIVVAIPIEDVRTGDFQGSLIATVRFKPVWDLLDAFVIEGQRDVYVVDAQNRIVAHTNPSIVLRSTIFEIPVTSADTHGLEQEQVVLTAKPLAFGDELFNVVVESPRTVALSASIALVRLSIAILLVATAIAVGVGIFLANQITQPVEELTRVADRFALGNLDERITVRSTDEIGELGQAFNVMASQIEESLHSLEKSVQEARLATAMAREANRLKSEFLSTMSHELRTPLNAIIGFAEIMMTGMSGPMSEKQQHKISRIHLNSKRLLDLINDLLDLAKIEAGRVDVIVQPFSPRDLATTIGAQMESLAEQRGIGFAVRVDSDLPPVLVGDVGRIEQAAKNLLSNAFKFTRDGRVEMALRGNGGQTWEIIVVDTGIGIPPHALEYIFDEFRQVDGTSQRAYGGSGLGLAITRNLARIMGGEVHVSSIIGEGSTFSITLPLIVPEELEMATAR